jgi:hypothetical protein
MHIEPPWRTSGGAIARPGLEYFFVVKSAPTGRANLQPNNCAGLRCSPRSIRGNNRPARCGPSGRRLPSLRVSRPVKSRSSAFVSCERQVDEKCPWPDHLRGIEARLRINRKVADAVVLLVAGLARDLKMARWMRQIAGKGCVSVETRMHSDQQNGDANALI